MTALEILKAARERIANPNNWLQDAVSIDGCKFCAYGAILDSYSGVWGRDETEVKQAISRLAVIIRGNTLSITTQAQSIAAWNDSPSRTHAEVLAAFDLAIASFGNA